VLSLSKNTKIRALPVQVIETPEGIIIKRGANEVMVAGANAVKAVKMVLDATAGGGATLDHIRGLFARSTGAQVDVLTKNLLSRHLLIPTDCESDLPKGEESSLDIFFWHFGVSAEQIMERLSTIRLTIVGVNTISRQLTSSLMAAGYRNFWIIDHPQYRNTRFFTETGCLKEEEWPPDLIKPQVWKDASRSDLGACLIATSDFGGQQALCEWNNLCIDRNIHFMPVVLRNMIGYVGPMIIPGETACYACLISRQGSHSINSEVEHLVDKAAFNGQKISGFHPSMSAMLGDIACFELTRFYGEALPERKAGRLLEVNLLAGTMTGRTIVKVPRCAACSPLRKMSQTDLRTTLFPKLSGQ
jgi:bacteriocin biosynthesis cyclodehydratase domain-containing protein